MLHKSAGKARSRLAGGKALARPGLIMTEIVATADIHPGGASCDRYVGSVP